MRNYLRWLVIAALIGGLSMAAWLLVKERVERKPSIETVEDAERELREERPPVGPVPLPTPSPSRSSKTQLPTEAGELGFAARLCASNGVQQVARHTLFGHTKQVSAAATDLVSVPSGFASGGCSTLHRDAAAALTQLVTAARSEAPEVATAMFGVSCHRSVARQAALYCKPSRIQSRGYRGQAFSVAPPGYSEHATGMTIDFGDRNHPECNVEACFGSTPVGVWLARNAGRFGFKMSFPPGNSQGVMAEPWHFRLEH